MSTYSLTTNGYVYVSVMYGLYISFKLIDNAVYYLYSGLISFNE